MNLNCGSLYSYALIKAVRKGMVTEKEIDELLYPLMLTRFQLGLLMMRRKCRIIISIYLWWIVRNIKIWLMRQHLNLVLLEK